MRKFEPMKVLLRCSAAAVLCWFLVCGTSAQSKTHRFYARVFDVAGGLLTDLEPSEFLVAEGGVARKVVRAKLGGDPRRILLLVDTSNDGMRALSSLRGGLLALIDGIPPEDEIVLVSTGHHTRVRVGPTTDRKKLKDVAGGLFSDGGGNVLLDSLVESDERFLANVEDRAPMIVIVSSDGPEGSNNTKEAGFEEFGQSVVARGIPVHAVVTSNRSSVGALPTLVANSLAQSTNGYFEAIYAASALPDKLKAVADQIVIDHQMMDAWYQVDYTSDLPSAVTINVSITRPGVKFDVSQERPH